MKPRGLHGSRVSLVLALAAMVACGCRKSQSLQFYDVFWERGGAPHYVSVQLGPSIVSQDAALWPRVDVETASGTTALKFDGLGRGRLNPGELLAIHVGGEKVSFESVPLHGLHLDDGLLVRIEARAGAGAHRDTGRPYGPP